MNEQKDRPMPNIAFRFMSLSHGLLYWFINPRKVLEKLSIKEGQTVLDFGCGPGGYTIPAARMVGEKGRIYALDIHPLAIKTVEKKAKKEGLTNITTILSDRDTGLPEESIDVILLYNTIHKVKNKRALLKELHRVMQLNGFLSIWDGHMKVEDVLEVVEKDGLFCLRRRHGKALYFESKDISKLDSNFTV
jgi:ubiquinone/menaquinone biosynthesis C-methylase UbiE